MCAIKREFAGDVVLVHPHDQRLASGLSLHVILDPFDLAPEVVPADHAKSCRIAKAGDTEHEIVKSSAVKKHGSDDGGRPRVAPPSARSLRAARCDRGHLT